MLVIQELDSIVGGMRYMNNPCNTCEKTDRNSWNRLKRHTASIGCDSRCEKKKKYDEYLERKRQYRRGKPITSMGDFEEYIQHNDVLYIGQKIYHRGWVTSYQYHTLNQYIKQGFVGEAIKKSDEK